MASNNLNIIRHDRVLGKSDYCKRNGHRPGVLWFTGLSGAGKSTLADAVEEALFKKGCYTYILDGDAIRHGLNSDLGFSETDRRENIRRTGEVARLFVDAGLIVLVAFISPYREDREKVRSFFEPYEFMEIYVKCDLSICENRDPKGLYHKARTGELKQFTGIDSPYEAPVSPELIVDTTCQSIQDSVQSVLSFVERQGILPEMCNCSKG